MRYCRSAVQKWELVMQAVIRAWPPEISRLPRARLSPMVEQAPYRPKNGMSKPRRPKAVPMHWFSRSPART